MLQHARHPQGAFAGVAADAQGQGDQPHVPLGEGRLDDLLPGPAHRRVPAGVAGEDLHLHPGKPGGQIGPQSLDEGLLGVGHAPDLLVGVQLPLLDQEDGLDVEDRRHGRRRRGDPAALLQKLQGVHRQVDDAVPALGLQGLPDLGGAHALVQQGPGVADALLQGDGDPPVVHHQHLPVVFPGQALGHLAGAAEPRRHGEVEDGVVGLQQGIPQGGDLKGSGLGGGDPGPLAHPVKKHGVGQVAALKVELPVDGKGHGDEMDPDLRRGCRGEPAVGVGHNGCFQGAHLPALIG